MRSTKSSKPIGWFGNLLWKIYSVIMFLIIGSLIRAIHSGDKIDIKIALYIFLFMSAVPFVILAIHKIYDYSANYFKSKKLTH